MNKYYYFKEDKNKKNRFRKLFGGGLMLLGSLIFIYFIFPILFLDLYYKYVFAASLKSPVPSYLISDANNSEDPGAGELLISGNSSNAKNWYPKLSFDKNNNRIITYNLSIPKLNIQNATVSNADYDLSRHLVQYLGTSYPGESGNAVIFGHSALPQLYNPQNYKTIFALLHTLERNDNVLVSVGGIVYNYKVFSITVADADDTSMFKKSDNDSYLTLVTCFPPGTVWRRLIVRAKLI